MTELRMHGKFLYAVVGALDPTTLWGATIINNELIQIPHNQYNLIALRNLGLNPPHFIDNPDVFVPEGLFKPFPYQLETAKYVTSYRNAWVLSSVGVGKTSCAIWAAEALRATEEVKHAVILCPLSTVNTVWQKEIFKLYPARTVGIVTGTAQQKREVLTRPYQYFVVNHDGICQQYILEALIARRPEVIICDEATAFKNGSSVRYESLQQLLIGTGARYWPMTATPSPQGPADMFYNQKLVCPNTVPRTLNTWKQSTMWKVSDYKWVPRPGASDMVKAALWPAIRFERGDVPQLGKPIQLEAPMSKEQRKVFNMMKQEMAAEWRSAHNDEERMALAANAADKVNKLLQIAQGNVYDIDKNTVQLENKKRLELIAEFAEQAGVLHDTKLILFAPFIHSMKQIHRYLNDKGFKSDMVNGSTPKKERAIIFDRFQDEDDVRILVAHPRVAAHGLTLTAASIILWYGPIHSLEYYEQGGGRVTRIGQKETNLQLVQVGADKVEWDVYKALDVKGNFQGSILDMYTQIVNP